MFIQAERAQGMGAKDGFRLAGDVLVMVMSGTRDEADAEAGFQAFRRHLTEAGVRRVLLDVRRASAPAEPEFLMARARRFAGAVPPCRVALFVRDLDGEFARIYRRAIAETGHEVQIFTDALEAEAWLHSTTDADALYLA